MICSPCDGGQLLLSGKLDHAQENMRRQRAADYQDHLRSQGSQHELAELARGTTHGAPGALPPRTNVRQPCIVYSYLK